MPPMRLLAFVTLLSLNAPASAQFLGKGVAEWVRDLERGDEKTRRSAAFALGKQGAAAVPALPYLKKSLTDDQSPKVREAVAFALGEIGQRAITIAKDTEIAPLLVKSLQDADPLVRRSAVYALGSLGSDAIAARPAVENLFADSSDEVRQSVAWALGRLGDETIPTLRRALSDKDALVQRDAAASLAQLDPNATRAALGDLARIAQNANVEVKKAALIALVRIVGPEDAKTTSVFAPLQRALLDGDEEIRRNAAFALSNIGGATAAPALEVMLDALRKGDLELKRQAAAALRNLGPYAERALDDLLICLRDPDPELRANAALALGGIGRRAESAVPPLVTLLTNRGEPKETRVEAAVALSLIGDVKPAVDAMPRLLTVLTNPQDDGKVRERVLWSLRVHNIRLRDVPAIFPAFTKVMAEPPTPENRMVRYDCAFMMGMIYGSKSPPETYAVLLEYLKDESIQVYRNKAILVGGAAKEVTTGKTSTRELGEGDGRKLALEALLQIGPAAVRKYPAVIEQIRRIADNEQVVASFRKDCRDFLRAAAP